MGRIRTGWATARVALLEARPMHCHRCLERGHVRSTCPSAVDRSGRCYRCGEAGHTSRDCRSAPSGRFVRKRAGRRRTCWAQSLASSGTCVGGHRGGAYWSRRLQPRSPPAEVRPMEDGEETGSGETGERPQPQRQKARKEKASSTEATEAEAPSDGGDDKAE
ncbi:PREDICTED: serine/arginine-rich splicing factor RS2Z32-like [Vollenhovia emeryi]|uniref:serine/arginine-rich splicing factor RS2Z32-like n=1 Tax=Vollenhovia emeryi TaxID=411798 RepID=UPI0005F40A9E|nr:PREDICTED: serine/arginine-rich splicing factor RS2Z32-like [Vollenhovia emeryi]